jgi:hypothetical protein
MGAGIVPGRVAGVELSGASDGAAGCASSACGEEKMMDCPDCCPLADKTMAVIAMTSNNALNFGGWKSIFSLIA